MSTPRSKTPLPVLDERIAERAAAIRREHPYWPCKSGCDLCCRSLPHLPTLTQPEWARLAQAIDALPADVREAVRRRTREVAARPPITCPLLDQRDGRCLVYEARPIACRTYGYYTERDAGLHCGIVSRAIEEHGDAERIVWGNGESIATTMRNDGEPRLLSFWMFEGS